MDKKKLEYFKKRLESRQVELRRMVTRTEQDGRTVDEDSAQDIADRAASSYTKEFLFHQSNNDRQLLQMVEVALERLREGRIWGMHFLRQGNQRQAPGGCALDAALHRVPGEAGTGNPGRDLALVAGLARPEPPEYPAAFVFCHPERSDCFAQRSSRAVEGPL